MLNVQSLSVDGSPDPTGILSVDNGFGIRMDLGLFKPYWITNKATGKMERVVSLNTGKQEIDGDGNYVFNSKGDPVYKREVVRVEDVINQVPNAPVSALNATVLTKDQWTHFDTRVQTVARQRLDVWSDIASAVPYGEFDGMGNSILQYETLTDDGEAQVDMDGLSPGRDDASHYQLEGLPIPITHSDWSLRKRLQSMQSNLQTTRAEQSARRIAEKVEQITLGTVTGVQFADASSYGSTPQIYGYTNHPNRVTKTDFTAAASTTGATFVSEVEALIVLLEAANFHGPFVMYAGKGYRSVLRTDYKATEASSTITTRQRLLEFEEISSIKTPDYLAGDVVLLVQMDSETVEAINGLDLQTISWETHPMKTNFKTLCIYVPFLKRRPSSGSIAVGHGTTS